MNSFTRFRPITSSLAKPVSFDALRFHTFTRPLRSMPKMGAFAVSIKREYSCSFAIRAVMSWPMPTTPLMRLCSSLRVVAFRSTSTRTPAFVTRGNSKFAVWTPARALMKTFCTRSLKSSVMNSFTRCRPITSSLEKPVRFDALRFHTLTRPFESMPKIGAFAVSMRRAYSCSCAIRAVMSWPMPTTPMTLFFSSRRVVALSSTCTRVPALVTRGNSKFAVSSPFSAFVNTPCTESL
mmetsp:Transcript_8838/g.25265  ORF Transcript_8838/g.25265 Transcript_8838/m.25265 type:complete len:237 (-) Transcript_8838:456-1166(-)